MLWDNQLSKDELQLLVQKGALQLGHFSKKYQQGRAGHWQELQHTHFYLDEEKQLEVYLVGEKNSEDRHGVYYLKTHTKPFSINGRLSYGAFLHIGDRVIFDQQVIQFQQKGRSHSNSNLNDLPKAIIYSDATLLLTGETGTGKGFLARKIYELRKNLKPWVHVNIAALAPSLIESEIFGHVKGAFTGAHQDNQGAIKAADQSVLFLDEIDSLPLELQSKLLVFLDDYRFKAVGSQREQQVKLKLIVGSGQSLEGLTEKGKFRKDLYFRLTSGFCLTLPSLRNKPELIKDFCLEFALNNQVIIEPSLIDYYTKLPWPGNYRQLKSHLERKLKLAENSLELYYQEEDETLINPSNKMMNSESCDKFLNLQQQKISYAHYVFQELLGDYNLAAKTLQISTKTLKLLLNSQIC
jgi:transcriptional regulator with PAS, ATPase and Fis domain